MDFVEPLLCMPRKAWPLLVLIDYTNCDMKSAGVARAMIRFFAHVGISWETLTDRGTPLYGNLDAASVPDYGDLRDLGIKTPPLDKWPNRITQTVNIVL